MSLFGFIVTADDVKRVQSQLLAAANATDLSLQTCQNLDVGSRAAWGAYLISVRDFAGQDVGFFNSGQMAVSAEKLADQFCTWQTQLAKSCTVPPENTTLCGAPGANTTSSVLTLAKYGMIVAVAIGGAYALGKVVEVLPHPLFGHDRK